MHSPTTWAEERLNKLGACTNCEHQAFSSACECESDDCVCYQERKVHHIMCRACGYVPETDEPAIYAQFGTGATQYRDEWQAHVNTLHEKTMEDVCHAPQWDVSYTPSS